LRLRPVYAVWTAVIGAIVLALFVLFAAGVSREAHDAHTRGQAELLTDIVMQSFLSLTHGPGGAADVEELASGLSRGMAGGIKWIKLISPEQDGSPYIKAILERSLMAPNPGTDTEGFSVLEVRKPIINSTRCSSCHEGQGDVLALLSVAVESSGYRADLDSARIYMKGLLAIFILVLVIAVVAFLSRETGEHDSASGPDKPDKTDETVPLDEGGTRSLMGFGSLFGQYGYLNSSTKDSDMVSMQKVEKMATIGELATAIAHEVKNPLAGISGAIQVLLESFEPEDSRREIMDEVLMEIDRLDKTIRDLNSFARPPEPSFIHMPISEVMERSVRLITGQAKKQGIDVNILHADFEGLVYADPDQLQQVFMNIFMNALHAMPEGGGLTVKTATVAEETIEITIADTGPGIKEASDIFEPFYTTRTTGTGLGLAISRNIIERHGGTIEFVPSTTDQPDKGGAVFKIKLPRQEIVIKNA